ncbi:MAG TPA: twitching motility protein [Desulfobulbus sp.]|nr:twitching motility protein [Desulfobulbus sp.]
MELKPNQSALILETDEDGEITVNVASGDHDGLTAAICTALARKLMGDPEFQEEIMELAGGNEEE